MLGQKVKRNQNVNGKGKEQSRILISVNVVGSAGPFRLIVNEDDFVVNVVRSILKIYAREGRLPVLGSDFLLFCPATASDSLPEEVAEMFGFNWENLVEGLKSRIYGKQWTIKWMLFVVLKTHGDVHRLRFERSKIGCCLDDLFG
ncbi:hypothetical protein QQ045_017989 [Rhodiola kirilowii]